MKKSNDSALVLLSGGLDSTTTLAIAKRQYETVSAVTFDYGQKHKGEIEKAILIGKEFQVANHKIIRIDLTQIGGSALTVPSIDVPLGRSISEIIKEIPVTYVPARNTIFLSFALGWAEVNQISNIYIGVNALDYSGYPDCRPEYIQAFESLANLATKIGVGKKSIKIQTPLISLSKAEIILLGNEYNINYSQTLSCYSPSLKGEHCGLCDACIIRQKGFSEANLIDPTTYLNRNEVFA